MVTFDCTAFRDYLLPNVAKMLFSDSMSADLRWSTSLYVILQLLTDTDPLPAPHTIHSHSLKPDQNKKNLKPKTNGEGNDNEEGRKQKNLL